MLRSFLFLSLVFLSVSAISQNGNRPGGGQMPMGRFYGKIVESKTHKPIEYASVQLVKMVMDTATRKRVEKVVAGMITPTNGDFSLENIPVTGQSTLRVTIVGYKTYEQKVSFDVKPGGDMSAMMNALDKDLGNIKIEFEEKEMEGVTVTASNPGLRLGIDRKVFNVDKNIVSAGGTAVDVMKNVPSVSVDIDGNVTMRNNAPQIFVDGRPTTMELDQIPADIIESIEIITNPSAKFDASGGTAGIINVVLKKNKKVGYNGSVRANIDTRARIGLGGDINLRQNKINMFAGVNYNQRKSISTGYTDRLTYSTPGVQLHQDDKSTMTGSHRFLRAGFDYFLDNRNTISLSGNMGKGQFSPMSTSIMHTTILSSPGTSSLARRSSNSAMEFTNSGTMLSYKHLFQKSGRELTADFTYNKSKSNSNNLISTDSLDYSNKNVIKTSSQRQDGIGANENFIFQTDFTNPITDKSKMEMGARVSIRNVDNKNGFYYITPSGVEIFNPFASVNYSSSDKVYAGYFTYTNQVKSFGYQLGLRLESSDYLGRLPDKGQDFNIKFPVSLFPSVFLSNKMKNDQELQLNYVRKINRPNFFQLYPYTDFSDSLNISRGNPNLKPEFTNSIELSYQKIFKKNKDNLLTSIYYKNTTDLIARYQVQELIPDTMLVNTYINASSSYVTGLEATLKNKITKWWDMTTNMNLFTSKIKTGIAGQPDQEPIFSWFGKLNNQFKLFKNLTLQVSAEYQSKSILPPGGGGNRGGGGRGGMGGGMWGQATSSQGYQRENYFVDAGLRFEFLKNRQASISLNVNDIFRTRRSDVHAESLFFTQDVFRRRDPQIARLNFNWRFGKFDPNLFKRKNNRQEEGGGMDTMGQ
jgi:outer membrane receptor protein involved in Fe transport